MASPLGNVVTRFIDRLESPTLFKLAAALFLLNLVVPDPIPLLDELLMAIAAMMLARRKKPGTPGDIDVAVSRRD
ncbi:MAG: DUF6116 family protein [Vicinamibacteria bacterium]